MNRNNGASAVHLNFHDIPLIGREEEVPQLRNAYARVIARGAAVSEKEAPGENRSGLILVRGHSGTGKSALVHQIKEETEFKKNFGFFCSGKFDQIHASQTYSAVVEAFTELCNDLVALYEADLEALRRKLRDSLGEEDLALLEKVIPEFRKVFGDDFHYSMEFTFRKEFGFEKVKKSLHLFLRSVCSPVRPIVIFIDDLQWADNGSLELIDSLLTNSQDLAILFVLAFRDDEVYDSHPLAVKLHEIRESNRNVKTTEIEVRNLDIDSLNKLVSKVTRLEETETHSLADVVNRKTQGNPYFALQFLRVLQDRGLLYRSLLTFKCEWDVERILSETSISDNVVEVMASKIDQLPDIGRESLKVAACLGTYFDSKLVAMVIGMDREISSEASIEELVQSALEKAAKEGLIDGRRGSSMYQFSHDRVQQGALSLNAEGLERDKMHLRIGRLLLRLRVSGGEEWKDWMLLVAADQLNALSSLISNKSERLELARLNLDAAEYVMKKSAFFPAAKYLKAGIQFVPTESKWDYDYDLMLELCSSLAEMEYCCGNFAVCRQMVKEVLANANDISERLRVQFIDMQAQAADGDLAKAIEIGLSAIRQLGEHYPKRPIQLRLVLDIIKTKRILQGLSDDHLLGLPPMTNPVKLELIKFMNFLSVYAWQSGQMDITASLNLRQLQLCVRYGLSQTSSVIFSLYGVVAGVLDDFDEAYRFGRLALQLLEMNSGYYYDPRTPCIAYCFLHQLKHPIHEGLEPLLKAYNASMETGDLMFAGFGVTCYTGVYLFSGLPLAPLNEDMKAFSAQLAKYRQHMTLATVCSFRQYALNLMSDVENPLVLTGEAMNQDEVVQQAKDTNNAFVVRGIWLLRMILGYLFFDLDLAVDMADHIWKESTEIVGTNYNVIIFYFFAGLVAVEQARKTRKRKHKVLSRRAIKRLEKFVGAKAVNCHHMLQLLYAECAFYKEKVTDVVKTKYDKAIASASRSGFVHHAALANERAGLFFLDRNDEEWAKFYFSRSHDLYFDWGAMGKVAHLEKQHAFLSQKRKSMIARMGSSFLKGRSRFDPESEAKHEGRTIIKHLSDGPLEESSGTISESRSN